MIYYGSKATQSPWWNILLIRPVIWHSPVSVKASSISCGGLIFIPGLIEKRWVL